eukprot:EG_transcript_20895
MPALTQEQINEFREAFTLFDRDGDGSITTKEIGAVMRALGQNPTEEELQKIIEEVDQDGNGIMDFEEFLALMSKKMHEEYELDDIEEAFRIFDKNQDGFISLPELRLVIDKLGERMPESEIKDMFNEVDLDKDGKISFQDFAAILKGA